MKQSAPTSGRRCARTEWRSAFDAGASALDLRREIELDVVGAETKEPELADEAPADLVLPNHKDLAYTKIRFDERSLATITDRLSDLADPLARTLCWNAVWEMVRDGDLAARRYVDIVLNNVSGETSIGVVGDLIGRVATAIDQYGDPSNRVHSGTRCRSDACLPRGGRAGSDFQLAWARAFIASATSDADVAYVKGLLDGSVTVPGLEIDTDMRWGIVGSLAGAGNADDSLISAELERDPTDDGERHAAAARASRPTAEAKAETWERVMNDTELSLAMLRALAGGFNRADQEEVLRRTRSGTSMNCCRSGSAGSSTWAWRSAVASTRSSTRRTSSTGRTDCSPGIRRGPSVGS